MDAIYHREKDVSFAPPPPVVFYPAIKPKTKLSLSWYVTCFSSLAGASAEFKRPLEGWDGKQSWDNQT